MISNSWFRRKNVNNFGLSFLKGKTPHTSETSVLLVTKQSNNTTLELVLSMPIQIIPLRPCCKMILVPLEFLDDLLTIVSVLLHSFFAF